MPAEAPDAAARFEASMDIDYEKWHDGVGYDLDAIAEADSTQRDRIEQLLLARGPRDWRDVEALASLGSPVALGVLRDALMSRDREIVLAVLRHAPELADEKEREAHLIASIPGADAFSGLTAVLSQVEDFHPPGVVRALLVATLEAEPTAAVHYAAMLYHLAGRAAEPFDLELRPAFLRFATPDRAARREAHDALVRELGSDLDQLLIS